MAGPLPDVINSVDFRLMFCEDRSDDRMATAILRSYDPDYLGVVHERVFDAEYPHLVADEDCEVAAAALLGKVQEPFDTPLEAALRYIGDSRTYFKNVGSSAVTPIIRVDDEGEKYWDLFSMDESYRRLIANLIDFNELLAGRLRQMLPEGRTTTYSMNGRKLFRSISRDEDTMRGVHDLSYLGGRPSYLVGMKAIDNGRLIA